MSWRTHHRDLASRYGHILNGFWREAMAGYALLASSNMELPTLQVRGCNMELGRNFTFDLRPLAQCWPELQHEWQAVREASPTRFPEYSAHSMFSAVLDFLFARSTFGETELPQGHWLLQTINALAELASYFAEVAINDRILKALSSNQKLRATAMYGKQGKRRQHRLLDSRQEVVRAVQRHGSAEIIATALAGINGLASLVQAARNAIYLERTQLIFHDCQALAMHWDGSTHGSKDVSLGVAVRADSQVCAYLQPKAGVLQGWNFSASLGLASVVCP